MSNRWQSNMSFSMTRTNAPFSDRQALNPNSEINTAERFWEYTAKVSGGYILPFDVVASANYERRQGAPQSRQHQFTGGTAIRSIVLNLDPLGTIRLPSTNLVIGAYVGGTFRFLQCVQCELRDGQEPAVRLDVPGSEQYHPAADSPGRGDLQLLGSPKGLGYMCRESVAQGFSPAPAASRAALPGS
jgi:hypothetical protein